MSVQLPSQRVEPPPAAVGLALFGAILLMLQGGFQVLQGIALLVDDTLFTTREGYVYELTPPSGAGGRSSSGGWRSSSLPAS